jgi:hypothetical protein
VKTHIPDAAVIDTAGQDVSFLLPAEEVAKFETLFRELENSQNQLGIVSYGVSATTLEDVFLRVAARAELQKLEEDDSGVVQPPSSDFESLVVASLANSINMEDSSDLELKPLTDMDDYASSRAVYNGEYIDVMDFGESSDFVASEPTNTSAPAPTTTKESIYAELPTPTPASTTSKKSNCMDEILKTSYNDVKLDVPASGTILTGPALARRRFRAMITKRFHYATRDAKAVLSQVLN